MNIINLNQTTQEEISPQNEMLQSIKRSEEIEAEFRANYGRATSFSPIPLQREVAQSKPFPFDALGDVLGSAAKKIHEVIQAPDAICGQSVLAVAALAAQAHADVSIDGRAMPISLYFLTIAESGERKSAADNIALKPVHDWQKMLVGGLKEEKQSYKIKKSVWEKKYQEILQKKSTNREEELCLLGKEPEAPREAIILVEEPTYEGLVKLLAIGQLSEGMFSDEGGRMFGGHGMNQDNLLKTACGLSSLWDGKPISRVRSGEDSIVLYGRRFSSHLMIQEVVLEQILSNKILTGQGLLARCLMVFPGSTAGKRPYKEVDLAQELQIVRYWSCINKLLDRPDMDSEKNFQQSELKPRKLELTPDAKRLWMSFHNELDRSMGDGQKYQPIRRHVSKAAEQALRIAGVFCVIDNVDASEVDIFCLERAIILTSYYVDEILRIHGMSISNPDLLLAQQVMDWLKKIPKKIITLSDVYQYGPPSVRNAKKARGVMTVLEEHYQVQRIGPVEVDGKVVKEAWVLNGC
ncbi:MAG: YfjI family protein [Chlamydiales bacterium]|nr:YfjI family protein [Chlamydiales bacterium]